MIGLICGWAYTCVVNVASERKGRSTEADLGLLQHLRWSAL